MSTQSNIRILSNNSGSSNKKTDPTTIKINTNKITSNIREAVNKTIIKPVTKVANNISKSPILASPIPEIKITSNKNNVTKNTAQSTSLDSIFSVFKNNDTFAVRAIFILVLVIMFGIVMHIATNLLSKYFAPKNDVIVVNGVRETNVEKKYTVNPNKSDPTPILRSINENQGMEFTWSNWVWIEDVNGKDNAPKRIFSKGKPIDGTHTTKKTRLNQYFLNNGPGLYLYDMERQTSMTNSLSIVMNVFNHKRKESPFDVITIPNIPMQKWVHIVIVGHNDTLDVYVNGIIKRREKYDNVMNQNFGDVYVGNSQNGMNGYVSALRYYNKALDVSAIQDLMYQGPLLNLEGEMWKNPKAPYLSTRWYMS